MDEQHREESTAADRPAVRPRPSASLARGSVIVAAVALFFAGALGVFLWSKRPRLTEDRVREHIHATLQREAPASFLVTGTLDVIATTRVENTRTVLPGIVDLELGTTSASVRVPGRVSYGFDVKSLRDDMIRVRDDVIEVDVPDAVIYSVEPDLTRLEIESRRGWDRLSGRTTARLRTRALQLVQPSLRAQAQHHLDSSTQPKLNTANALYALIRPVLIAAGIADPEIRFRIGRTITVEPGH